MSSLLFASSSHILLSTFSISGEWNAPLLTVLCIHNREKTLFSLKGNKNKEKRMTIYKFLLQHFTDEQRFNVTNKLAHDILGMNL